MNARKTRKSKPISMRKLFRFDEESGDVLGKMIRAIVGGLIGFALTILFSLVVLAFIAKAFLVEASLANQLLNSAITVVGTTLGAVLGYFLGKNSNHSQN